MKTLKLYKNIKRGISELSFSLERIFVFTFVISALVPLILIGSISYNTIYSMQKNKVVDGIHRTLAMERENMDNRIRSLDSFTKLLSLDGESVNALKGFFLTDNLFEKSQLREKMKSKIDNMCYANPDIGLVLYYLPDSKKPIFGNFTQESYINDIDFDSKALITQKGDIKYYGPGASLSKVTKGLVLAVERKVYADFIGSGKIQIFNAYVETDAEVFLNLLNNKKYGITAFHCIVNDRNEVLYSDNPQAFSDKTILSGNYPDNSLKTQGDYIVFKATSDIGWKIFVSLKKSEFDREINKWFVQMLLVGLLSIFIVLVLASLIYEAVIRPIKLFGNNIQTLANSQYDFEFENTRIEEFNRLQILLHEMRLKINNLIDVVKQKEKHKRRLEVEKLLYQINPHFVYNTLDTVKWLARIKGENEIVDLVAAFNKVLHYNLGKADTTDTTIRDEIAMLDNYISILRFKSDLDLQVKINEDPELMDIRIPRFVLQPIVENAIQYGRSGTLLIEIDIRRYDDSYIEMLVKDNGKGMSEYYIETLLESEWNIKKGKGPGIGINYVNNMLRMHYGECARMIIHSKIDVGTVVTIRLPNKRLFSEKPDMQ